MVTMIGLHIIVEHAAKPITVVIMNTVPTALLHIQIHVTRIVIMQNVIQVKLELLKRVTHQDLKHLFVELGHHREVVVLLAAENNLIL